MKTKLKKFLNKSAWTIITIYVLTEIVSNICVIINCF